MVKLRLFRRRRPPAGARPAPPAIRVLKKVSTACTIAPAAFPCQAGGELLEVALARHIAEFDQHRGHVGRLQHLEARRLQGVLVAGRNLG